MAATITGFALDREVQVPCRSWLASEKRQDTAIIQTALVIVDVYRWQASSYREARVSGKNPRQKKARSR